MAQVSHWKVVLHRTYQLKELRSIFASICTAKYLIHLQIDVVDGRKSRNNGVEGTHVDYDPAKHGVCGFVAEKQKLGWAGRLGHKSLESLDSTSSGSAPRTSCVEILFSLDIPKSLNSL